MAQVKGELERRPRRFYATAASAEIEGGWGVKLDGKPLRTPARKILALPTQPLAQAVADEWQTQGEHIDFAGMHLFRLANVAIDRTPETREAMADEAARYAATDLLCHLAEAPQSLRAQQDAAWAPLRAWASETLGVHLRAVEGILALDQPAASLQAVKTHARSLDDFRLTALVHAVALFGSAVLALAVERQRISADEAHALSRIDEAFQARQWGEDAEAVERAGLRLEEARALDRWFAALTGS